MNAIILDTETNDKDNPEVMELAFIPYADPFKPHLSRYCPTVPVKWGALAVHHILMDEVRDCPPSSEAAGKVPKVRYWIGHNIDFDWKALGSPSGVKRICTLALCRSIWPEVDSHTLSAMSYFLLGANPSTRERVLRAHSALDDVLLCSDILQVIMTVLKISDLDELYLESEDARIPKVWTLGKFKGQPIGAADRGYANWCRKQPDFDPYVLIALTRAGL